MNNRINFFLPTAIVLVGSAVTNRNERAVYASTSLAGAKAPIAEMTSVKAKRQTESPESASLKIVCESQDICAGSPIPAGWIVTGGKWCPTCCGGTSGRIYNNVLTITKHINLPVGSVLDVCSGQSAPDGWVIVGGRWCPTCCGGTSGGIYNNVIQIKRIN